MQTHWVPSNDPQFAPTPEDVYEILSIHFFFLEGRLFIFRISCWDVFDKLLDLRKTGTTYNMYVIVLSSGNSIPNL